MNRTWPVLGVLTCAAFQLPVAWGQLAVPADETADETAPAAAPGGLETGAGPVAAPAEAAAPVAESKSDDGHGIEEIFVTAQKRSESLQSTPLAVSAFTSEALEQKQISGVQQLQFNVPSLVFAENTGFSQISLRGIGSDLTVTAGEPTVATFQDGVYTGQLIAQGVPSFDLERIEVLRGPQGTLYGRNSTGGTINYITKLPSYVPEVNTAFEVGSYGRTVSDIGVTGGSVEDKLAGRLSIRYENRDGYRKNLYDGSDTDDLQQFGGRASVLYEPTEDLSVVLRGDASKKSSSGTNQFIATMPNNGGVSPQTPLGVFSLPGPVLATLPGPLLSPEDLQRVGNGSIASLFGLSAGQTAPNLDPTSTTDLYNDTPAITQVDIRGVSATVQWKAGAVDVKSITAGRYSKMETQLDGDGSAAAFIVEELGQDSKQFTQEFNISGQAFDDRLDWIAGGFYLHDKAKLAADLYLPALTDQIIAGGSFASATPPPVFDLSQPYVGNLLQLTADPVLGTTLRGGTIPTTAFLGFGADQTSQSTAGFGQATYKLTDSLRVTGGLRYTQDEKKVVRHVHSNFVPAAGLCDQGEKKTWDALTGTAGLDYDVAAQTLVYGKVSNGYKSGGFNPPECSGSFDPEKLMAYEVGLKSTFADGQVRTNLASFYYKFDDIQFTTYNQNSSTIRNAANATLYGVELEYTLVPDAVRGFVLDGSGSYIHSEYGDQDLQEQLGSTLNIGGNQLIRAPEWKLNFGAQYTLDTAKLGAFTLRGEGSYTSTTQNDVFNGKAPGQDATVQPSYWITNARLIWEAPNNRIQGQLFVENIGDEIYSYSRIASATGNYVSGPFSPPRTIGARIAVRFGG
ncbi:MAG: hypothetical protein JWQ90_2425 [Hydrocarboniphaga sp.]|uniref:TonB-dependent receptor n=1 Tax=Hydrocarboniphaga sp. TaxID=2033016 RepID=UPI00261097AD|nr:TonB-dependent receptor [Hydrocarboniphaga sp.]MDB5969975.1 hypothetical protein [Hydrocarboniphaga sp.]